MKTKTLKKIDDILGAVLIYSLFGIPVMIGIMFICSALFFNDLLKSITICFRIIIALFGFIIISESVGKLCDWELEYREEEKKKGKKNYGDKDETQKHM